MPNHHALVIVADSFAGAALPVHLQVPSLDVVHLITERLLMAEARQLILEASTKPVTEMYRTFVIQAGDVPVEAQNALLKLFEEPPQTTRFVLIIPRLDMLVPTLRSRVHVMSGVRSEEVVDTVQFDAFLNASYADRLALIAEYAKDKDSAAMEAIVRGAERYASSDVQKHTSLLRSVLLVRDYFAFPGASRKMLLESLALSLPKT